MLTVAAKGSSLGPGSQLLIGAVFAAMCVVASDSVPSILAASATHAISITAAERSTGPLIDTLTGASVKDCGCFVYNRPRKKV